MSIAYAVGYDVESADVRDLVKAARETVEYLEGQAWKRREAVNGSGGTLRIYAEPEQLLRRLQAALKPFAASRLCVRRDDDSD